MLGTSAGAISQRYRSAIAVDHIAGYSNQDPPVVANRRRAGNLQQRNSVVAIGNYDEGNMRQDEYAVAIGSEGAPQDLNCAQWHWSCLTDDEWQRVVHKTD